MAEKLAVHRKVVKRPAAENGKSRAPLNRDRVLRAAIAIADEEGIEGLSMRRLAQELGVEAMSLYYYFRSKDKLLGEMLDVVFSEFERPATDGDWRDAMRSSASSAHHELLRHPWACGLLMNPTEPSRHRFEWMNSILGLLRGAGFSTELTHHAYHALDSHIIGFTLWVLPYIRIAREQPDFASQALAELPVSDLPHLAEHIDYHMADDQPGDTSEFDFGLNLLLDSLERMRTG